MLIGAALEDRHTRLSSVQNPHIVASEGLYLDMTLFMAPSPKALANGNGPSSKGTCWCRGSKSCQRQAQDKDGRDRREMHRKKVVKKICWDDNSACAEVGDKQDGWPLIYP